MFGFAAAKKAQLSYNQAKSFALRAWDRMMYSFERERPVAHLERNYKRPL